MPSLALTLRSPAKLNLALDVLRKRDDGFHEIRTVFERIDLSDTITLQDSSSPEIRVRCAHPQVPKDGRNLAVKIAQRLKDDFKIKRGLDIKLVKHIPVAAGLAGGSSNGAAVLMGLNQWWRLNLSPKQLHDYGAWLGSDVPFFLSQASFALGEGRGEKIHPIQTPVKLWHVLVTPRVTMLTKDVFARFKLNLTKKVAGVNILLPFLRQGDARGVSRVLSNDLESAIVSLRPDFIYLKEKLRVAGASGVCFSGSGPSVYALAQDRSHALKIRAKFDKRFSQVFVVSTL